MFGADAHMFGYFPEERTPANYALSAFGNSVPGVPNASLLSGLGALGATVWHGSPHKIVGNKFRKAHVGTGEGAQAYGTGAAYLAEQKGVGQGYADKLAGDLDVAEGLAEEIRKLPRVGTVQADGMSVLAGVASDLSREGGPAEVVEYFRRLAKSPQFPGENVTYTALADLVEAGQVKGVPAYLYEVDLPDEAIERMLDWDAPLSEQSESVQKALREAMPQLYATGIGRPHSYADVWSGRELIKRLEGEAEKILEAAGVPGIKYYDGSSRRAGKGTRNFVVFGEDTATILSRNGEKVIPE